MTQIVLDPEQLSQTASMLSSAAGEYQAIGAQVHGCDCGCMPPDVAAVVDSATALARSVLQGISSALAGEASDLSQRASVAQNDGFGAVSAAWGGPASTAGQAVIGSSYEASGGDVIGGSTFTIGDGGDDVDMIGGSTFTIGDGGDDVDLIGGSTFTIGDSGGSSDMVGGSTFTIGGGGGSTDMVGAGTFTVGGGGGSTDMVGAGTFTVGVAGIDDMVGAGTFTVGGGGGSTDMISASTFTMDSSGGQAFANAIVDMAGDVGGMANATLDKAYAARPLE